MAAVVDKSAKRWTYAEYSRLGEEQRYEILNGELLMAPSPDTWHQNWVGSLFRIVDTYVRQRNLGKVFLAPLDVVLDPENTVQPDLIFIGSEKLEIVQRPAVFGVPDLLIEIVSPSSVRRDRYQKKELYARFGVKEYWIGDPANRSLEILTLKSGQYELYCAAEETGALVSPLLAGLQFNLQELL